MRNALLATVAFVALVGCGANLEKAVVGDWGFELDAAGMNAQQKASADLMKGMLTSMTLTLKADKTATMKVLGQEQAGTWTIEGENITITSQGQPLRGKVIDGGKKIEVADSAGMGSGNGGKMFLVKK